MFNFSFSCVLKLEVMKYLVQDSFSVASLDPLMLDIQALVCYFRD